jgi:acetoacetyl-CoA synthetase
MAGYAGVRWHSPPSAALVPAADRPSGYRWFPEGELNYAEGALAARSDRSHVTAVVSRSQSRPPMDLTWAQLADLVARARAGLVATGAHRGERVAAYLPNIPETLAAMLACASLGLVWSSCPPETGVTGALDRLSQLEPSVFLSIDGYRYGPKVVPRRDEALAIRRGLPTVRAAVWLPYLEPAAPTPPGWQPWAAFTADAGPLEFVPVAFDHPLYVLFSSGTTGKPKAIAHGHGGMLLEHAKALRFHFDLGPADRFFWFTTTGWMMWNFYISGLITGSTIVMFDGDPAWPGPEALWEVVASTGTTCAGVSAGFLAACMKQGLVPRESHDLSALRALGSTGSPLPAAAAEWSYQAVADDMMLGSFSGGTDVCTGFVGPSPLHPVWAGEISCRCLGARVNVFNEDGQPVVGEDGELVLSGPMPSMPVGFWGDEDGSRYRAAYFERFPGVWAHGDHARLTERGSLVISGRSDGTLNRGGVRMGTAEFYAVVEELPAVADSLVVHLDDPVVLAPGAAAGRPEGLEGEIKSLLRRELSPRHVPDRVITVPAVPRTLSGKKLEVPVKHLLSGAQPADVVALASVADPASLEPFVELARQRASSTAGAPGP